MLSYSEKQNLYKIISAVIGEDASIKTYIHRFNDSTVSTVEAMIEADSRCNASMKELLKSLLSGGSIVVKGWLKKALRLQQNVLNPKNLKGMGCLVSAKARWKNAIIISTL